MEIPNTKGDLPHLKVAAKSVLKSIDQEWNKLYDTPFTKVLTKIPSTNLKPKTSDSMRKKKLRKIHRNVKKAIENSWQADGKDMETLFGTRQSKATYVKQRSSLHFEKKSDAISRTSKGII